VENKLLFRVVDKNKIKEFENKFKDPEEKVYLICISGETQYWSLEIGRSNARQFIIDNISDINFEESFIIVEGVDLLDSISIYVFMKHIEQYYPEDTFDIDDYVKGDWEEEYINNYNEVDNIFNNKSFNLKDVILDKDINTVPLE